MRNVVIIGLLFIGSAAYAQEKPSVHPGTAILDSMEIYAGQETGVVGGNFSLSSTGKSAVMSPASTVAEITFLNGWYGGEAHGVRLTARRAAPHVSSVLPD